MIKDFPKYFYALDISRGIASLSVVLTHWGHFNHLHNETILRSEYPFYSVFNIFYDHGGIAVAYFFQLSGFIFFLLYYDKIESNTIKFKQFAIARFSRLYPLHLITLLACLLLQTINNSMYDTNFVYKYNDIRHFFLNIFMVNEWGLSSGKSFNGPFWSVSIEMLLYILFFFLAKRKVGTLFTCILLVLVAYVINHKTNSSIFYGITSFFTGGLLFYILKKGLNQLIRLKLPITLLTITLWFIIITFDNSVTFRLFIKYIAFSEYIYYTIVNNFVLYVTFPFTILTLAIYNVNKPLGLKKYIWIGKITYSTYLLHFPLQLLFALFVFTVNDYHLFYLNWYSVILFFILLIPISLLSYHYIELPIQSYIRKKLSR